MDRLGSDVKRELGRFGPVSGMAPLVEIAPHRMAFAPGPLPEPALDLPDEVRERPPEPTPEHIAKADSLTRVIRDEELRKVVAKAVAASLSRDDNDRSFC
jgi:hypothetical protein